MSQLSVFDQPKARASDPDTSHAAALVAKTRAGSQRQKLWKAFLKYPQGLTDLEAMAVSGVSPRSEYATRCSELRNAGVLEPSGGSRLGEGGVLRMVSRVTPYGRDLYQEMFS